MLITKVYLLIFYTCIKRLRVFHDRQSKYLRFVKINFFFLLDLSAYDKHFSMNRYSMTFFLNLHSKAVKAVCHYVMAVMGALFYSFNSFKRGNNNDKTLFTQSQ